MSQQINVFVKHNGILVCCQPYPAPAGAIWHCAMCGSPCISITFGVMNGLYRCLCGSDIEVVVDGQFIDLKQHDLSPPAGNQENQVQPTRLAQPAIVDLPMPGSRPRKSIRSDADFLKQCGISMEESEKGV